jgi:hypothetical protein
MKPPFSFIARRRVAARRSSLVAISLISLALANAVSIYLEIESSAKQVERDY